MEMLGWGHFWSVRILIWKTAVWHSTPHACKIARVRFPFKNSRLRRQQHSSYESWSFKAAPIDHASNYTRVASQGSKFVPTSRCLYHGTIEFCSIIRKLENEFGSAILSTGINQHEIINELINGLLIHFFVWSLVDIKWLKFLYFVTAL